MALNINGTTGISGVDGSASAPALTGTDSNTGINFASDTVNINTSGLERMRIQSDGDVSFSNSATGAAQIKNVSGDQSDVNSGGFPQYAFVGNEGTGMRRPSENHLAFDTTGAERMRIDSGGKLLVGTTSGSNFSNNVVEFLNTNADAAVGVRSTYGASNQNYITFQYGGGPTACGGIRRDGTNNSPEFFSSSDRRIKTNILDMDNTLDKINQLSLKKFNFKLGGSGVGVIAQDLINIFPNKVKKDDSDDGTGDTVPDGVDPWTVGNNFTYELLKAVQELSAKVETLETKVAALEAG